MTLKIASEAVTAAVREVFQIEVDATVDYTEAEFGDVSSNVAFQLAGQLKKPPSAIAEELAAKINHSQIERAGAAKGFVNLTFTASYWGDRLESISPDFGRSDLGRGQKVQVEFISANPTGPLTLANARGGFLGDVLSNVLARAGYEVTREYYFNDAGNQIKALVASVRAAAVGSEIPEDGYRGDYIKELALEFKDQLNQTDEEIGRLLTQAIFQRYLQPSVDRMNIKFDVWFNERELVESGKADEARERLKRDELIYDKDGAVWLASSKLGDDRDRVLVRSEGRGSVYLDNDIPYHLNIFEERKFHTAIKLLGPDHAGQVKSLAVTIKKLVPGSDLRFIVFQAVRLMKSGSEVKMSKRAGQFVTVDDLINEVGADVARFFFLMRSPDSHMDFDLDLAKEQSQKNPLFYLMYAYVRANSILKQAEVKGLKPVAQSADLNQLERRLTLEMSRFPELIEQAATDYGVHRLTFYGLELARLFHDYYESERIIDLPKEMASVKLYLIQRYIEMMKIYFETLGIKPLEKM